MNWESKHPESGVFGSQDFSNLAIAHYLRSPSFRWFGKLEVCALACVWEVGELD